MALFFVFKKVGYLGINPDSSGLYAGAFFLCLREFLVLYLVHGNSSQVTLAEQNGEGFIVGEM